MKKISKEINGYKICSKCGKHLLKLINYLKIWEEKKNASL